MRKILAKSLLAATLITNTAYADENTQPTAEDRGATSAKVHIQINPELSKREDAYKQAVEKLSAEQQKQLENLDTQITQAHEPEISVAVQSSVFKACAAIEPEFEKAYKDKLTSFRLKKQEELFDSLATLSKQKREYEFIDQKLIGGHHAFQRSLQMQFISGTANVLSEGIKSNPENTQACDELKTELSEEFKEPYFVDANTGQPGFNSNNLMGQKMCGIGFKHKAPSGDDISIGMIYFKEGGQYHFDVSAKILAPSPAGEVKSLPVEDAWVDFGAINTQFWTRKRQPYPSLYIMSFEKQKVVNVLHQMRQYPTYVSTKNPDWENKVVFSYQYPPSEIEKMAKCVTEVDSEMAKPLKDAGF